MQKLSRVGRELGAEETGVAGSGSISRVDSGRSNQVEVVWEVIAVVGGCGQFSVGTNFFIEGTTIGAQQETVDICAGESVTGEHTYDFQSAEHDRSATVELVDKDNNVVDSQSVTVPGTSADNGGGGCTTDSECAFDEKCSAGTCVSLNCGPDEKIEDHSCVPTNGNGGCQSDGDCPSGQICQNGTCVDDSDGGFLSNLSQQEKIVGAAGLGVAGVAFFLSQNQQQRRTPRQRRRAP